MQVHINHQPYTLPDPATVADAVAALQATPPYAVAVNRQFVPRPQHASHVLREADEVEVIRPVTGG